MAVSNVFRTYFELQFLYFVASKNFTSSRVQNILTIFLEKCEKQSGD